MHANACIVSDREDDAVILLSTTIAKRSKRHQKQQFGTNRRELGRACGAEGRRCEHHRVARAMELQIRLGVLETRG
jgi:hypothetical protein